MDYRNYLKEIHLNISLELSNAFSTQKFIPVGPWLLTGVS